MMLPLLLAAQAAGAAAPAPPPPRDLIGTGAAAIVTHIALDASGRPTGCATTVSGMNGSVDGCLLFARPDLLSRWLGQPLAGLASVEVRLEAAPAVDGTTPAVSSAVRHELAQASLTVSPSGSVRSCAAAPGALDLCRLLPQGEAAFTPDPAGAVRNLVLRFALVAAPR